ncbi:MAG: YcbK family protein [Desulfobacterales bacterium]|jgi:uncharacterized protein YcbK (DUF882 family)
MPDKTLNRRLFIKIFAQTALWGIFPVSALAAIDRLSAPKRTLLLYNIHTGQRLDAHYYAQGRYQRDALKKINYILRDYRTGEIKPIRKELLNLLYSISRTLDRPAQFHIISGYRSPETNAMLRRRSNNVAKNSLHMEGEAVDIRIPGCDTTWLRTVCMKLRAGGVGYYPKSEFVHVDIGPVRYW